MRLCPNAYAEFSVHISFGLISEFFVSRTIFFTSDGMVKKRHTKRKFCKKSDKNACKKVDTENEKSQLCLCGQKNASIKRNFPWTIICRFLNDRLIKTFEK